MKVIIKGEYQKLSRKTARIVAHQILSKKDTVLGLPTGNTPIGMYQQLVKMYEYGLIDFSKVITFNLDEYYGIPPDHPKSFHRYMKENFFRHVNINKQNFHIPNGTAEDIEEECKRYEDEIKQHGGIDLQILGIGYNGHIGFNEPGTDWGTDTRLVELSEETKSKLGLGLADKIKAISMGIRTIMRSRKILLLASGREKAEIIKQTIHGPITKQVPASILQLHPDVTVVLDEEAASLIKHLS
jgi:glucosamine-6-phosphate deaminase